MRIIACDDDKNMLALLEKWVKEYMEEKTYHFFAYDSGIELLKEMEHYKGTEPQILFMDIKLKNDNGIDVEKLLNEGYGNTAVIFVSGYTEYLEESFEADSVFFLVKPLKKDRFEKAMEKATEKLDKAERKFLLLKGKELRRVFYDEIYYIESAGRKLQLFGVDGFIEYYAKMDSVEEELKDDFVRCHKSFIVNLMYVRSMDGKEITLMNGKKIPISRNRVNETKQKLFDYLGGLF